VSTTAASGLLAIVVCAALQGNPLQMQLRLDATHACLLLDHVPVACVRRPAAGSAVESGPARR